MLPVAAKPEPAIAPTTDQSALQTDGHNMHEGLFANAGAQASFARPNLRRTGIRAVTQSPVPANDMLKTPGQRSASALDQAESVTAPTAKQSAKPPLPSYSPGRLQHALQMALGQLPKT